MGLTEQLLYLGICLTRPKINNCVVRVTAEKTLGRVCRYFFVCGSGNG